MITDGSGPTRRRRWRAIVASLLIVPGCVLAPLSLAAVWTRNLATFAGVLLFGVLGGIAGAATYRSIDSYRDAETLPGLVVCRFDVPVFFAYAAVFRDQVRKLVADAEVPVREVIVNAEAVYDLDTTGVRMLDRLLDDLDAQGVRRSWARVRTRVRQLMRRTGLEGRIGDGNFHLEVTDAVAAFSRSQG